MLILLHGCTGTFGLRTEDDCIGLDDSEKIGCYHEAAITSAHISRDSDSAARLCFEIMDEVGDFNRGNDVGRRAEIEKNACLYDIVKITARYDGTADRYCDRIQDDPTSFFKGADVTNEMCHDQYHKQQSLRDRLTGSEGSLCTMTFGIILLLAMVFYRSI
jgi:hypothetical protein